MDYFKKYFKNYFITQNYKQMRNTQHMHKKELYFSYLLS